MGRKRWESLWIIKETRKCMKNWSNILGRHRYGLQLDIVVAFAFRCHREKCELLLHVSSHKKWGDFFFFFWHDSLERYWNISNPFCVFSIYLYFSWPFYRIITYRLDQDFWGLIMSLEVLVSFSLSLNPYLWQYIIFIYDSSLGTSKFCTN